MFNVSFASSSQSSTETPVFQDDNLKCYLCSINLGSGHMKLTNETPYDTNMISQMCYTICSENKFSVCGPCVTRHADERIEELKSILENEYVFNRELKSYRKFQANHTCVRSNHIKMYTRDKTLDSFAFQLYIKSIPECTECQTRESIIDNIRGSWKGYSFIRRHYIEKLIESMEITKRNFKWCSSIHKLHKMFCSCEKYSRLVYTSHKDYQTSD
jgi:hypothetical protein